MRKDEELAPEIRKEVEDSLPELNRLRRQVSERRGAVTFPFLSGDHVGMAWICLSDATHLIEDSIIALRESNLDWRWALGYYEENTLLMAVGEARYSFDYAANLMVSASNHLAAAMWHFHETEGEPLDRYDAMSAVVRKWTNRSDAPESLSILNHLAASKSWNTMLEYRHKWVHRGLPVIRGEFRHAKRALWTDDASSASDSMFRIVRPDGMISHPGLTMAPEYEMTDLLSKGALAIHDFYEAAGKFIKLLDAKLVQDGWVIENGKMRRSF